MSSARSSSTRPTCPVCGYAAENELDLRIHDCGQQMRRCKREITAALRAIENAPERALRIIADLRERVPGLGPATPPRTLAAGRRRARRKARVAGGRLRGGARGGPP